MAVNGLASHEVAPKLVSDGEHTFTGHQLCSVQPDLSWLRASSASLTAHCTARPRSPQAYSIAQCAVSGSTLVQGAGA